MDRVLVVYGTQHGRTGEIALAIGEQLSRAGHNVDVKACGRARVVRAYAAVVVVSAVTHHGWEKGALDYLRTCGDLPARRTRLVEWQPGPPSEDDHQLWGEIRRWAHELGVELTDQLVPTV